jgi:flotillin
MAGFRTIGPNQALIVSGGGKQPRIVVGGRTFVLPVLQRAQVLSLEVMTLIVETPKVYTKEGVAVSVDGVAQVKVARSEDAIMTAAQQFLGKRPEEIAKIALQTMEGHQRAMLGTMTVEEIYRDRETFARQVREVASTDMAHMGMEIVSFTIRDIRDEQGYLAALGVRRTAEVKRDAAIGQADAERDAGIRAAQADRERQAARFQADTAIAESERDFKLQKAAYDQQVNARQAEAELAYQLQEAKTRQQIRQEEIQIEVVEREKQIDVQQQEILRRERELDATVRRPSEAERDRLEVIAEGQRRATRVGAEAERYQLETLAAGNKARIVAEAEAEAEAIRLRGQAEAGAIIARGTSEAEAMRLKAEAWKEYGQAAVIEQLIRALPELASAVAEPLSKTERIVMISGGNGDSPGAGASRLTRDITTIIAQLPAVLEALTGVDVLATVKNLPQVRDLTGQGVRHPEPENGRAKDGSAPVEAGS